MQNTLHTPSILGRLKAETQDSHNKIEKVSCMKRLFASDYSIVEYRSFLERMFGFYSAIEPIIFHHLSDELRPHFQFRSKIESLKQDLIQLGLNEQDIAALPRCTSIAFVNSVNQSLGIWYVLEGSTLGGQVISRQLKQQFGDSALHFMHFHNSYGDKTRSFWSAFCEVIEENIDFEDNQKVGELIHSAKLTFDYLTVWLGQESVKNVV
jgi:heme oxygenase